MFNTLKTIRYITVLINTLIATRNTYFILNFDIFIILIVLGVILIRYQ